MRDEFMHVKKILAHNARLSQTPEYWSEQMSSIIEEIRERLEGVGNFEITPDGNIVFKMLLPAHIRLRLMVLQGDYKKAYDSLALLHRGGN